MIRPATFLAIAAIAAPPVAATASAAPGRTLQPGAAKCSVNDEKAAPCQVRKNDGGGLDVETNGDQPVLAMVVEGGLSLFALVGEARDPVPLIMEYSIDPGDRACWRSAERDAVVWRLCVR